MVGQQVGGEQQRLELSALARCHRLCLPNTASSAAGVDVLEAMYRALEADPGATVLWEPGPADRPELGAFASGTRHYRETELSVRRALPKSALLRLMAHAAKSPQHLLARRRWESLIPRDGIGYLLTLGVARAVVPEAATRRGHELLADLEAWFAAGGCRESFTDTELANTRAHAFYVRAGYAEVSRSFGQVLLRKPLAPNRERPRR